MGGPGDVHCPLSGSEKRIQFQVGGPAEKRVWLFVCVCFSFYLHLSVLVYVPCLYLTIISLVHSHYLQHVVFSVPKEEAEETT